MVGIIVGVSMGGPGIGAMVACTPGGDMYPRSMEPSISMAISCTSLGVGEAPVSEELMVWRACIILSLVVGFGLERLWGQNCMVSLMIMAHESLVSTR